MCDRDRRAGPRGQSCAIAFAAQGLRGRRGRPECDAAAEGFAALEPPPPPPPMPLARARAHASCRHGVQEMARGMGCGARRIGLRFVLQCTSILGTVAASFEKSSSKRETSEEGESAA